jgi:hypothetical protein
VPELDSKLVKICNNAYNVLCAKVVKGHFEILDASLRSEDNSVQEIAKDIEKDLSRIAAEYGYTGATRGPVAFPLYYRKLFEKEGLFNDIQQDWREKIREVLGKLMEDNLALYRSGDLVGCCKDNYFCVTIDDKDLPWDTTQSEW